MDDIDKTIINRLQGGFPICERPFAAVAETLALSEGELISRIDAMLADGTLTRFGPLYQIERMGGRFSLAAMAIPAAEFDRVAEIVNAFPEVAHNYERNHRLNMWFVLATETPEGLPETITRIKQATGYPVYNMPKEKEFFVNLYLTA